jgi:hypothetical protein
MLQIRILRQRGGLVLHAYCNRNVQEDVGLNLAATLGGTNVHRADSPKAFGRQPNAVCSADRITLQL